MSKELWFDAGVMFGWLVPLAIDRLVRWLMGVTVYYERKRG
jgi:hypothetical protein